MIRWILKDRLAGAHRPRAASQRHGPVAKREVDAWIEEVRQGFGIRSIICLLDERELLRYETLPTNLLRYYERKGFEVVHIPAKNYRRPRLSKRKLKKVWKAYKRLPKPVLVHCSAGIGRTGAAAAHIRRRETL